MSTYQIILACLTIFFFLAYKYQQRRMYKIIIESCRRDMEEMEAIRKIWEAEKESP